MRRSLQHPTLLFPTLLITPLFYPLPQSVCLLVCHLTLTQSARRPTPLRRGPDYARKRPVRATRHPTTLAGWSVYSGSERPHSKVGSKTGLIIFRQPLLEGIHGAAFACTHKHDANCRVRNVWTRVCMYTAMAT